MTLAIAVPLLFVIVGAAELAFFRSLFERGTISGSAARVLMIASLSFPIIIYVILAVIVPDVGAIEVW